MNTKLDQVKDAVASSFSTKEVAAKLGIKNPSTVRQAIKIMGLDTSHFIAGNPNGCKRKWTDEQFIEAVKTSYSVSEVLRKIGLSGFGDSYQTVHKYVTKFNLDTSHWTGQGHLLGKTHNSARKIPLSDILKEGVRYNTTRLKNRLLKSGLMENKCCICTQGPKWNKIRLVLVLDHINGVRTDNRIENLRLLCPNCNSQQLTFCRPKT